MNFSKTKTTLAWMAIAAAATASAETTMTVNYLDESRSATVVTLNSDSKLIFGGSPYFDFSNISGAPGRISVADVKRITFYGEWMGVETPREKATTLRLRQNPVDDILYVEGYAVGVPTRLSVFSIAGREAVRIEHWHGEDVDVSQLPKGVYILRINHTTLKFVKK